MDLRSLIARILIGGAAVSLTQALRAQVYEGDLYFRTQLQVDSFTDSYASSEVTGSVWIEANRVDPITNLNGLSSLTKVGGSLRIYNVPGLRDVEGLGSLASVGGTLEIIACPAMTSLVGLRSLTRVGGLQLVVNPVLELDGPGALTTVEDSLIITFCGMGDLDGLGSLKTVGGSLTIYSNPALTQMEGLNELNSTGGDLVIESNPMLANLDGLRYLGTVGGSLFVRDNPALAEFCGLYRLLDGGGLAGAYHVSGNGKNPTAADILAAGSCYDLKEILKELVDEGVLNDGQANALAQQAALSLRGLGHHLEALVKAGILSEGQAKSILVAAAP